ncbi:hypothetical protein C8D87_11485 [Lentzea atacamensis]|uniref:Uncharacterized protein n=1 Tax=Lentzea atacamensis TaxID=531938 RepID=A0ABX9DXN1_9PSEU|nr:hypothetical protein [Lentzea atacamensis]RAS59473.1 hypothetical protein C8D87_11485 [Lentzea atacamensis]
MADLSIETPLGLATLSLDSAEMDVELLPARPSGPAIRGDRVFVRSVVPGHQAAWAVFERAESGSGWSEVTPAITADQLAEWRAHRAAGGSKSRTFNQWLTAEVEQQRLP